MYVSCSCQLRSVTTLLWDDKELRVEAEPSGRQSSRSTYETKAMN